MNEAGSRALVLPGELLGTAEEFVPGHGTYEDHGKIYAALMGHRRVDPSDGAVHVEAIHAVPEIHDGDAVLGRVDDVKTAMVIVTVLGLSGSRRTVPGNPEATIHVSKAKEGYTDSLANEFSPGDVVVARVLQAHPTIKLTTGPGHLGVVAARCQVCHALLARGPQDLVCPRCGNREHRKLSRAYGELKLDDEVDGPRAD